MPLFKREKTLTELQEEDDRLTSELSVTRKRALIKELEDRAGQGSWKIYSDDGTQRGIPPSGWRRIWSWLRTH